MSAETLDAERLAAYLGEEPVSVEPLTGGHSNLTYLIRAGARKMVLRRPPVGSRVKSAHDMGREYRVLSHIHGFYPRAPKPFHYCADEAVIGAPFYLMEWRDGRVIRRELPEDLHRQPESLGRLSKAMVESLVELHALDWRAVGLEGFGRPEGYVQRQVDGWARRWCDCQTETVPMLDAAARWLSERIPPERGAALIHNDYKLDNLMLDDHEPDRIVAVLDWEMATIGDPLMDLGTTLSYWVEPGDTESYVRESFSPTVAPGFWTRRQALEYYTERSGRAVPDANFYYVYGLFKLAVIIQQIYYRYARGLTRDERFARFPRLVRALADQTELALARGPYCA